MLEHQSVMPAGIMGWFRANVGTIGNSLFYIHLVVTVSTKEFPM